MSSPAPQDRSFLISKPRLTIQEMAQLIASSVAGLPTVRSVEVIDGSDISVDLNCGKRIEFQTMPIASRFNASADDRRQALADVLKRCA